MDRAGLLAASRAPDAQLTLGDLPRGWTNYPQGSLTGTQRTGFCGKSSHRTISGARTTEAFTIANGPGYPLIMEQLNVLATPERVAEVLASAEKSSRTCSTFHSRGYTYRLTPAPALLKGQRSVAVILHFVQRAAPTTEYLAMIKHDNVLIQVEEATPATPDVQLLRRVAKKAVQRVVAAES
jgi:hypothetical protein